MSIAMCAVDCASVIESDWSTCNRVKGYEAVSLSTPTMDDRLHIMLNGEPLETWDPHPAAEAWSTATKQGVQHIANSRGGFGGTLKHPRTIGVCTLPNAPTVACGLYTGLQKYILSHWVWYCLSLAAWGRWLKRWPATELGCQPNRANLATPTSSPRPHPFPLCTSPYPCHA